MKVPWWPLVGFLLGVGVLVGLDRYSTREDRWKQRLAETATRVRSEDSVSYAALVRRFLEDSVRNAALVEAADAEEILHTRLTRDNGKLRVALAHATTLRDTVTLQAAIIVTQDSALASDSIQKLRLRAAVQGHLATIVDLKASLDESRGRLANLVKVATPPKVFRFLSLSLSLKPYVGVGINLTPQGKVTYGAQLGLSILRG